MPVQDTCFNCGGRIEWNGTRWVHSYTKSYTCDPNASCAEPITDHKEDKG